MLKRLRKYENDLLTKARNMRQSEPNLSRGVIPPSDYDQFQREGGFLPDLPQRNQNIRNFSNFLKII